MNTITKAKRRRTSNSFLDGPISVHDHLPRYECERRWAMALVLGHHVTVPPSSRDAVARKVYFMLAEKLGMDRREWDAVTDRVLASELGEVVS